MADAAGDFEMKCKNILEIALPGNGLAIPLKLETAEACNWTVGSMFTGNPFGIVERQGSGCDRDHFMNVQNFLLGFGGIDSERNRFAVQQGRQAQNNRCKKTKE